MSNAQLKADAMHDVRNVALGGLGVGALGAGAVGLINLLRKPRKNKRSGPAELPLPYPVEPSQSPDRVFKVAGLGDFLSGNAASTKAGLPWYGPAMMLAGMGGLAGGWKGMDYVLDKRRQSERDQELSQARKDFHDALLSQYDKPLKPKVAEEESVMTKVSQELDALFDDFDAFTKAAGSWSDIGGAALGGYGIYAGLTGLATGALVYDKMRKRSRQAVIEKALQRKQRRQFMQSPTEIYAVPEPVTTLPRFSNEEEADMLKASMAKVAVFAK